MRASLVLLLLAASGASAQAPGWRLGGAWAAVGVDSSPGVRVERQVAGDVALGLGRTEWGGATAYLALHASAVGPVTPRAFAGLVTLPYGRGVGRPTAGVGADVALVGPLAATVDAAYVPGDEREAGAVVRLGLAARADRLVPAGASRALFAGGRQTAAPHVQWTAEGTGFGGFDGGADGAYVGASVAREATRGGALGWGVAAQAAGAFVFGDTAPCDGGWGDPSPCPSGPAVDGLASVGAFGSVGTRDRIVGLWLRGGPELLATWGDDADVAPGVAGAVGIDVFPTAAAGVGLAIHGSASAVLTTAGYRLGLRVRVPTGRPE